MVITVEVIDFRNTEIREAVTQNPDGSYTIFLNARYSRDMQQRSYLHALRHIINHDFEKEDVQEIEMVAHGII